MGRNTNIINNILKEGFHRIIRDFNNHSELNNFHNGIDITGNPEINGGYDHVVAFADGIVVSVKNNFVGFTKSVGLAGMGNYVIIDHGNGYITRYTHLTKGSIRVKRGQKVSAGEIIGYMGSTGNTPEGIEARRLHFDVSVEGKYVDPKPFLYGTRKILSNEI